MTRPSLSSRRDFLRQTARRAALAAAAVGLSVPDIVPRSVLATELSPGANDRIGIGGIGVGRQGGGLMGGLPKEARVVAVADVNLPRAQMLAKRWDAQAYQDYRDLLDRKDVDAIVTATPDHWRALVCIHACQAGKDIYAEKPLSLTIREGRLMAQAVRKYDRVFQTGSQQRSLAQNRLACELVLNGRIGKVHTVLGTNYPSPWECGLPGQPVPEGLDWDRWCGPTEPVPYHIDLYTPRANPGWISFRPYSGGEMTGWGSHGLDQVQWALGMDTSGPVEVWVEGPKFNPPTYTAPEPRARGDRMCSEPIVFFRYANGVVLKLAGGPPGGATFIGQRGRIIIDRGRFTAEPEELGRPPYDDLKIRLVESNHHMQNWFDCMRSRQRCVADVEIGHRSATVCHLGNIARWLGRRLQWDPVKEVFIGDEEANTYLDRPRRKPYELPTEGLEA